MATKKGEAMLPELSEISAKRKRLGMTQTELSKLAGISQSLVAKIESGVVVPSYGNAKRIFDLFESMANHSQLKALDFMSKKVISTRPDATLKEACRLMKRASVSQLPVIDDGKNVGVVSEKIVLDMMNNAKDPKDASALLVKDTMEEAMPVIREETPFKAVSSLLEANSGALVGRRGKIVGIITKADLLGALVNKKQPFSFS